MMLRWLFYVEVIVLGEQWFDCSSDDVEVIVLGGDLDCSSDDVEVIVLGSSDLDCSSDDVEVIVLGE